MSFMTFVENGLSDSGKTKIWSVNSGFHSLGQIRWYAPWRRYTFYPEPGSLFDAGCLTELSEFVSTRTKEHKEK